MSDQEKTPAEKALEVAENYADAPCFAELLGEVDDERGCGCPVCGLRTIAAILRPRELVLVRTLVCKACGKTQEIHSEDGGKSIMVGEDSINAGMRGWILTSEGVWCSSTCQEKPQ